MPLPENSREISGPFPRKKLGEAIGRFTGASYIVWETSLREFDSYWGLYPPRYYEDGKRECYALKGGIFKVQNGSMENGYSDGWVSLTFSEFKGEYKNTEFLEEIFGVASGSAFSRARRTGNQV